MSFVGVALILLSRFFWGVCQIVFKDNKHISVPVFAAYSYLFALPFTAIGSVFYEHYDYRELGNINWDIAGWPMVFEVVALTAAMFMWQRLIAANGVNKIAPFSTLRIIFGIAAGVIMFDDEINWQIMVGAILVTFGVILTMKEFNIILKAHTKSIVIYRRAHHLFMERKLKRISLRKKHR